MSGLLGFESDPYRAKADELFRKLYRDARAEGLPNPRPDSVVEAFAKLLRQAEKGELFAAERVSPATAERAAASAVASSATSPPAARREDPDPSRRALELLGTKRRTQQAAILRELLERPGQTAKELGLQTGVPEAWKRCSDLEAARLIVKDGERACAVTGNQATVFRPSAIAVAVAEGDRP